MNGKLNTFCTHELAFGVFLPLKELEIITDDYNEKDDTTICVSYALSQFLDALYFAYTFSPHIFFKVVLVVKFNKLNSLDSYPNYFMLYLKQQKHLILSIAVIRILVVCCLIPGNLYYEFKKTFEISGNQYKCKEYHFLLVLF